MAWNRLTAAILTIGAAPQVGLAAQAVAPAWPAIPLVHGPLRIHVAHPAPGSSLEAGDSIFIFGTVGDGSALLTIAGQPVKVAPNGAWLAWIAIPRDSSFVLPIQARHGSETSASSLRLVRTPWVREAGAWIDRGSLAPAGDVWMPAGEPLALTVRAAAGAMLRLVLPNGRSIPFFADSIAAPPPESVRAFDHDERNLRNIPRGDRYVAVLRDELDPTGGGLEPVPLGPSTSGYPILEIALGADTTRVPWPLEVTRSGGAAVAVVLDGDPLHRLGTDGTSIGRSYPTGTYAWFFPRLTRAAADMRIGDQVRLRLSHDAIAWVPLSDVTRASAPDDPRLAIMGSPTLTRDSGRTRLRIPLTRPVPMSVDQSMQGVSITLFGALSNANWTRYGADQHFVQLLTWRQQAADRVVLTISFARPLWGWRVWVDGTDLVYEFREPPDVDPLRPLAGRRIVVDPGHPPAGACGPTRLCEPEVNLAIARAVRDQLTAAGATVIMTRENDRDVALESRVALADSVNAEMLVSIHNNALPDGLNPFANNGTATFFNHPHALELARAVQTGLVATLGLRDLGIARGDYALTRPTWYPAILTEGLFLMIPEQEAALRTADGQRRYATGIVAGVTTFLRDVARTASRGSR